MVVGADELSVARNDAQRYTARFKKNKYATGICYKNRRQCNRR